MSKTEPESKVSITKHNSEVSWFIADRWFRILEFSLILATLHYFNEIINNKALTIIYWLSWALFWSWFEDIGKFFAEIIYARNKLSKSKKVFVWVITTIFVMAIYALVTSAANSMIAKQYL